MIKAKLLSLQQNNWHIDMKRNEILNQAKETLLQRQTVHGDPHKTFTILAETTEFAASWSAPTASSAIWSDVT